MPFILISLQSELEDLCLVVLLCAAASILIRTDGCMPFILISLQSELEDLCFVVLHPAEFRALRSELDAVWGMPRQLAPTALTDALDASLAALPTAAAAPGAVRSSSSSSQRSRAGAAGCGSALAERQASAAGASSSSLADAGQLQGSSGGSSSAPCGWQELASVVGAAAPVAVLQRKAPAQPIELPPQLYRFGDAAPAASHSTHDADAAAQPHQPAGLGNSPQQTHASSQSSSTAPAVSSGSSPGALQRSSKRMGQQQQHGSESSRSGNEGLQQLGAAALGTAAVAAGAQLIGGSLEEHTGAACGEHHPNMQRLLTAS
jgi:hypothetical protein